MSEPQDHQATLLQRYRQEGATVAVWLISGKRLVGKIKGFDRFTIVLEYGGAEQLVFKHAIGSIGALRER